MPVTCQLSKVHIIHPGGGGKGYSGYWMTKSQKTRRLKKWSSAFCIKYKFVSYKKLKINKFLKSKARWRGLGSKYIMLRKCVYRFSLMHKIIFQDEEVSKDLENNQRSTLLSKSLPTAPISLLDYSRQLLCPFQFIIDSSNLTFLFDHSWLLQS